jgi:D-alanyl-D-alanine carboxypeptidase (penicillin-binding protein 5/6)
LAWLSRDSRWRSTPLVNRRLRGALRPRRAAPRRLLAALVVSLLLAAGLALFQLNRALPAVRATQTVAARETVPGTAPAIPWPRSGSAALGAAGLGLIDASPGQQPLPMWSMAKVMTALLVLEDHPLKPDQPGPSITITAADVQAYQQEKANQESVVAVEAGEQLSEYQALQAMLIPSGNNVANLLAAWDAGGVPAFVQKMNARAHALGMRQTTYTDPSGLDAGTRATASDLTQLAAAAIADPVLSTIVSQPSAQLPVAGTVYNVDYALGRSGIAGIKTGSNPDAASAGFMFAAPFQVAGHTVTVVGAILGLSTLDDSFAAARTLIDFARPLLTVADAVREDEPVGRLRAPWGQSSDLRATADVALVEWPGKRLQRRLEVPDLRPPLKAGATDGWIEVVLGDQDAKVALTAAGAIDPPGRRWRLTRLA